MGHARSLVIALAVGTAVLTLSARPDTALQDPQNNQSELFTRLFLSYSEGNHNIVSKTLVTLQDYRAIEQDFASALGRWQLEWKPVHAGFALELIVAGLQHNWPETATIVTLSRQFVMNRPEPIGANPDHDAFELLWHRTVVALLEWGSQDSARPYLEALAARVSPSRTAADGRPRLNDTRFVLQRAQVAEQRIMPGGIAQIRRLPSAPFVIGRQSTPVRILVDDAMQLLNDAAKYPEIAHEAHVRKALLLLRLGRPKDALPLVENVYGRAAEPAVNYLAALVHGRVLEALNRPDDAAEAYKRSLLLFPRAQSPLVAMAALRLKQNLRADALEWASRARTTAAEATDPWWDYWMGDFRLVPTWLTAIRQAAQ